MVNNHEAKIEYSQLTNKLFAINVLNKQKEIFMLKYMSHFL